tara:strand:+ start:712 stop:966 length:255 start_codon:yes stop_codon:yes gene_type:complete
MHDQVKYWQADEIAECLPVTEVTYAELWNRCVPLYDKLPRSEIPGEITYALADYGWDHLSEVAQDNINDVFLEIDRKIKDEDNA